MSDARRPYGLRDDGVAMNPLAIGDFLAVYLVAPLFLFGPSTTTSSRPTPSIPVEP